MASDGFFHLNLITGITDRLIGSAMNLGIGGSVKLAKKKNILKNK
jgi:hypothetical protein